MGKILSEKIHFEQKSCQLIFKSNRVDQTARRGEEEAVP